LQTLLNMLKEYRSTNVFNPWAETDPLDRTSDPAGDRIVRLEQHFACKPTLLLVAEAPSRNGCRMSGIPMCSERLLLDGVIPRVQVLDRLSHGDKPLNEMTATIVWRKLRELGLEESTLLWNAFAWHPHKPNRPYTNRTPTKAELLSGLPVLQRVISLFPGAQVIAVGGVAAKALDLLKVYHSGKVRHPSMGGAKAFATGINQLVQSWA
jgi:hypothetical protein